MNEAKLRSMIIKKSNGDNNMSAQLYQMFFFERILERISKSKYKNNIILKGGLLLASIIGEDERTTKEITYNYNCIFEDKRIPILAYTLETVIAEKYHCIVARV